MADYVFDHDREALADLCRALDAIVDDPAFVSSTEEFQAALLNRAGIAHQWRGVALNSAEEQLTAVRVWERGLFLGLAEPITLVRLRCNLTPAFTALFQLTGEPDFLASALDNGQQSVSECEDNQRLRVLSTVQFSNALRVRYRMYGDLSALTEAITLTESCIAETTGRGGLGELLSDELAQLLSDRYDTFGRIEDLERAIGILRDLENHLGHDQDRQYATRSLLGTLLRRRYLRHRNRGDLDEAIRLLDDELQRAPDDPARLTNLGNALSTRCDDYGDRDDLFRAVDLQEAAVEQTRQGDWQLASRHNNAGNALLSAWLETGEAPYWHRAQRQYRLALDLTDELAPERSSREYNLARTLHYWAEAGQDQQFVDKAVAAYRDAVRHGLDGSLEWALGAATSWGHWATTRASWQEACEAFGLALEAVRRLIGSQPVREHKETWLAESQGLPALAGYALARVGRYEDAVLALDEGQSLLLAEAIRPSIAQLTERGFSDLAERYRQITASYGGATPEGWDPGTASRRRGELGRDEFESVVAQIRQVSGYEQFLARPGYSDIRESLPADAVGLYLAAAEPGGVALLVRPDGSLACIDLPGVSTGAVEQRVSALFAARTSVATAPGIWEGALDSVTRWAWYAIIAPVLPELGHGERVVLFPSGLLAMLPLHAAWTPCAAAPTGRRYLLDEKTVSYTPNALALRASARIAATAGADHLLAVVDPQPSSWRPIGYASAESEWVRHWFPTSTVLEAGTANYVDVTAALTDASVYHFICHGLARPRSPLDSALILAHDAELAMRDLIELRLRDSEQAGARLAVLSACDTDQPGITLPDEVISLPTGLIQAGVAGVIATQWSIRSEATSLLIARFYQLWRQQQLDPPVALRQAQRWLRDTTNREKLADLAQVTAPLVGDRGPVALTRILRLREPDERPYQHPTAWAAFAFHGA